MKELQASDLRNCQQTVSKNGASPLLGYCLVALAHRWLTEATALLYPSKHEGKKLMNRYRIFMRKGGMYYIEDAHTGKQESLRTKSKKEALRVLNAKHEAQEQPTINLQIARAYLHAADPAYVTRTWSDVFACIIDHKNGSTKRRWVTAEKDKAFDFIKDRAVTGTPADAFLKTMRAGSVSTNIFLRRVHNYALDMAWILNPVIPRRAWPTFQFKDKRAITKEEHQTIIAAERNLERKAFYETCWHIGASQGDVARLHGENIDWAGMVINFDRAKTRWRGLQPPQIKIGPQLAILLKTLPTVGPLFPYLITVRSGDRATEFGQRCRLLGIKGVSLHSYRYAWAERAQKSGYPERFAMLALGHNSKAISRAYAKRARVEIPALEEYEQEQMAGKIIPMPTAKDQRITENPDDKKMAEGG